MTKILLDTDIGTDIDDALCLAYLLREPRCELLGITTVTGEPERRAVIAAELCRRAGRTIPIFAGAAAPMVVPQQQLTAPQADFFQEVEQDFPAGEAVEFLRSTIRRHPGEITLLTIGPLTNVGLLFAVDPEIPGMLKSLVSMCGLFKGPIPHYGPREWNAFGDPHASAIVYRARPPVHRSVGLDVTSKVFLDGETVRRRFTSEPLSMIVEMGSRWIDHWGGVTFHDPLAAVSIFDPEVIGYERGTVTIDLGTEETAGTTHWQPDPSGPHEAAVAVLPERFFERFLKQTA